MNLNQAKWKEIQSQLYPSEGPSYRHRLRTTHLPPSANHALCPSAFVRSFRPFSSLLSNEVNCDSSGPIARSIYSSHQSSFILFLGGGHPLYSTRFSPSSFTSPLSDLQGNRNGQTERSLIRTGKSSTSFNSRSGVPFGDKSD